MLRSCSKQPWRIFSLESTRKIRLPLVPWKTSDVVVGLVLVVLGLFVLLVIYGVLNPDPDEGSGSALLVIGAIIYGAMLAVSWGVGPARRGGSLRSLGLKLPSSNRGFQLVALPALAFGASLVLTAVYAGIASAAGLDLPDAVPEELDLKGPALVGSFALVVVWGPLAEEIFFRGFMFPGFRSRMGLGVAAIASSLLFSLSHLDPRVMVPIFLTGLLLAWLYHRTGSIWPPFIAHALQNALAFSVSVVG